MHPQITSFIEYVYSREAWSLTITYALGYSFT
jgi:hypothetical protein